jgi:hypothetical protein
MEHAKVGDIIKILDDNYGDWVIVGKEYYVESVSDGAVEERVYELRGVDSSWCGEPSHFEIISSVVSAAKTHPRYDTFHKGNTVRRWRDVEDWEWESIGEVDLPDIGDDVEVESIDMGHSEKEPSFYSKEYGYWYPMKAFVLAEYYNQPITNRGTAGLNNHDHGKSKISTGISIEVQRPSPSISTGQRTSRGGVQGRGNGTVVGGRYSSHKAITGR